MLRFLHFTDIMNQPNKKVSNCDMLLKMRTLLNHLDD